MSAEPNNYNTEAKHSIAPAEGSEASYWKFKTVNEALLSNTLYGTVTVYKEDDTILEDDVAFEISMPAIVHNTVTESLGYNPA